MKTIENYIAPEIEIIEVAVEKGFATSTTLQFFGETDDLDANY